MILICSKLPTNVIGGVEKVVEQYVEVLRFHEKIILLTYSYQNKLSIQKDKKVLIIKVPPLFKVGSYSFSIRYFILLLRLVKKARIINVHAPFPLTVEFLAMFSSHKCVLTWHGDVLKRTFISTMISFSHTYALKKVSKIIFTSNFYKQKYFEFYNKSVVIPLWLNKFVKSQKPKGDLPKEFALFLGRFGRYKGLDVLEQSVGDKRLDSINFLVVGEGSFLPIGLQNRPNVKIIDKYVTEEVKNFLFEKCKIFLFPSSDEGEAFGITQLEALRVGKPIINTNLKSGVPWVSQHMISGLTIPPIDTKALSDSILKLWYDKKLYSKLSKGALMRYKCVYGSGKSQAKLKMVFEV